MKEAVRQTRIRPLVILVVQIRVTRKGRQLPLSNLAYTKGLITAKCLKRRKKSTNDVHHTGKTRHTRSKREGEINIAHPPPARDLSKERHAYCQGPPRHLAFIRGRSGALRVLVLLSSVVLRFCDVRFWTRHRKGGLFLFFFLKARYNSGYGQSWFCIVSWISFSSCFFLGDGAAGALPWALGPRQRTELVPAE